jgi:hypothetical protein
MREEAAAFVSAVAGSNFHPLLLRKARRIESNIESKLPAAVSRHHFREVIHWFSTSLYGIALEQQEQT